MTCTNILESESSPLRIEGEMTIYQALELKQTLLAYLEQSPAVEVDLSGVTEIDTAGVQLLLLALKTAQAKRSALRLVAASPAVREVLELLNLAAEFGEPHAIAPASM